MPLHLLPASALPRGPALLILVPNSETLRRPPYQSGTFLDWQRTATSLLESIAFGSPPRWIDQSNAIEKHSWQYQSQQRLSSC